MKLITALAWVAVISWSNQKLIC